MWFMVYKEREIRYYGDGNKAYCEWVEHNKVTCTHPVLNIISKNNEVREAFLLFYDELPEEVSAQVRDLDIKFRVI